MRYKWCKVKNKNELGKPQHQKIPKMNCSIQRSWQDWMHTQRNTHENMNINKPHGGIEAKWITKKSLKLQHHTTLNDTMQCSHTHKEQPHANIERMRCSWRHKEQPHGDTKGTSQSQRTRVKMKNHARGPKWKDPLHLKGSTFIHDNQCLRGSTSIHDKQHRLEGSAFNKKGSAFIHDNQCLRITHIVLELYVGDGPSAGPSEFQTGPSAYWSCAGISNLEGPALRPFSYTKCTPRPFLPLSSPPLLPRPPTRCIGN